MVGKAIRSWLRNLCRRSSVERALDDEMRACVEILAAQKMEAGFDPREARRQALLEIGGIEIVKERVRDGRRGAGLEAFLRDLRHAARMLRRERLLTIAVVLTMAVGIGSVASVFALLNGFVFRAPVSRDPDAFFRVARERRPAQGIVTFTQFASLKEEVRSARQLVAWSTLQLRAPLGSENPDRVPGLFVTCNFFGVFGVDAPIAGRLLDEQDCASGAPVAVMSDTMWRTRFGSDPAIVGASLRYGRVPITIVGIAAAPPIRREAHDPDPDFAADVWFPYTARALKDAMDVHWRQLWSAQNTFPWLEVAGLLRPGETRETSEAEFRSSDARYAASGQPSGSRLGGRMILTDGSRWTATPDKMVGLLAMALAVPALVMVVACLNAASLLLSRAVGRHREMAIRLALGTGRGGLVRMLLTESLLLSVLAAAAAMFLVYALPRVIVRFLDAELWFGAADALAPDWRVIACLTICAVVAAMLSGVMPALESMNPRLRESLQGRPRLGGARGTSVTRRVFVGIQIAASMVPLVVAANVTRAAARATDPGIATDRMIVADLREQPKGSAPLAALADTIAAAPGVQSVASTTSLPLVAEGTRRVRIPDSGADVWPLAAKVSPAYFDVFDIPILAGQGFPARLSPAAGGPAPIVVSKQFARRFFPGGSALGSIIETTDRVPARLLIVGICGDRIAGFSGFSSTLNDGSMIYELMEPAASTGFLVIKTRAEDAAIGDGVRQRLREATGAAVIVESLGAKLAARVVVARRIGTLLLAMGMVSLLLAVVGVAGGVSFDATRRRREFAIRLALGALPSTVRRGVVLSGLKPFPAAVFFGVLASWAVVRVSHSIRLLSTASLDIDPAPYVAISLILVTVAVAALFAVAHPVGRRDPLASLREE